MRRWFELGLGGNIFTGPWSLLSNRWGGQYNAQFVSMPHKEILFEFLSAAATAQNCTPPIQVLYIRQIDQGVDPAPDCPAFHLDRSFSPVPGPLIGSQSNFLFGPLIFTTDGTFSGGSGPSLFRYSSEPPDETGA